ncbi:hypothetical protein YC2023_084044 [Brassica napus]
MEETAIQMAKTSMSISAERKRRALEDATPERVPATQRLGPSSQQKSRIVFPNNCESGLGILAWSSYLYTLNDKNVAITIIQYFFIHAVSCEEIQGPEAR